MGPVNPKKRKQESSTKPKAHRPNKKFKKQTHYSSSSSSASADEASDFPAVNLADNASEPDAENDDILDPQTPPSQPKKKPSSKPPPFSPSASSSSSASDSDNPSSSASDTPNPKSSSLPKSKRNDPSAFASSITSILTSKLSNPKRSDPVLARSASAQEANAAIREARLEKRARQQLRAEKKALLEKGRVKDVLLGVAVGDEGGQEGDEEEEGRTAKIVEEERKLKKLAQRGVIKMFNAVRMAQVRGEEARREAVEKGVVGAKRREERVGEMSKKGFLELVASGGGKGKGGKMSGEGIEEA
ncbi:MAG: hypothetical protein Q9219_007680 [cf. Caloplaca sp. 3 TL-2023]